MRRTDRPTLNELVSRRRFLAGIAATTAVTACGDTPPGATPPGPTPTGETPQGVTPPIETPTPALGPGFVPVAAAGTHCLVVSPSCSAKVLLRWGDAVVPGPAFAPAAPTADGQAAQFGFNCDFNGYCPLAADGSPAWGKGEGYPEEADRGLLCTNHEAPGLMFPAGTDPKLVAAVEMRALGLSVVEIVRSQGVWSVVADSKFNRRLHALTPGRVDGPAAGSALLRTAADPEGQAPIGTFANCSGGMTPWGTVLSGEENVHGFFTGPTAPNDRQKRYALGGRKPGWDKVEPRFNIDLHPNEPHRFGWIVEIDPHEPDSPPVKHTALGRFAHEAAGVSVRADGRVVVYLGDDGAFEYLYRFVSDGTFDPNNRVANKGLLNNGQLSVARFSDAGDVAWLALDPADPRLAGKFSGLDDVLVHARLAADLLGATPLDRPEDVVVAADGRAFVMLTNNKRRGDDDPLGAGRPTAPDAVNRRKKNAHGQVVMITPSPDDPTAGRWSLVVEGGPPSPEQAAPPRGGTWLSSPDNATIDPSGALWVATDSDSDATGQADAFYHLGVEGDARAVLRRLLTVPTGAEATGPCFARGGRTLFLSVQHPAEDSTFEAPTHRWPDEDPSLPPRPSVIVVERLDGRPLFV